MDSRQIEQSSTGAVRIASFKEDLASLLEEVDSFLEAALIPPK